VIEGIFAVLYVSHSGLTHCYKTVVFFTYIIGITEKNRKANVFRRNSNIGVILHLLT